MNFNKFDIGIILSMSIAVILMSFTFPALGLSSENVSENDIPEFNLSKNQVSFANEAPEYPGNPSSGTLEYVEGAESYEDNRQVYLSNNPYVILSFFDDEVLNESYFQGISYLITYNSSGYVQNTSELLINESETKLHTIDEWEVVIDNMQITNPEPNAAATLDWELEQSPEDTAWSSRIPIVGGIFSGAQQVASILGWIGSIIYHYVVTFVEATANILLIFYTIITFFIDAMVWLVTTYTGIVGGTPAAWAGLIVAIPGILLSLEFVKVVAIGISLLPTT